MVDIDREMPRGAAGGGLFLQWQWFLLLFGFRLAWLIVQAATHKTVGWNLMEPVGMLGW